MTKKLKIVGALFAIALAAAGILVAVYFMNEETEIKKDVQKWEITNYTYEDVEAIYIKNTAGEQYTIGFSEDVPYIEGIGKDVPLQRLGMLSIVDRILCGVSYSEPIPVEKSRLEEYGLADPQAIFTIALTDGTMTNLRLGNQTVKKNGYYIWLENTSTAYIVENIYQTIAQYDAYDYIDPVLVQIPQEQAFTISRLSLSDWSVGETVTVALKKEGDGEEASVYSYMVTYPEVYDASDDKLRGYIFDYLVDLRAEDIYSLDVSDENLEKLGLLKPRYTLEIEDALAGTIELDFSCLGDGTVLALIEERPVIYQMAGGDVPFLEMTLDQFVSPFITLQPITEIEGFSVFDGEKTYDFVIHPDTEGTDLQVTYGEKTVDTDSFRKLYSRAATIYVSGMAEPPEEKDTALRLIYHRIDDQECVVEFLQLDGRYCYALLNGEGRFSVELSDIEYFLDGLAQCVQGETLSD